MTYQNHLNTCATCQFWDADRKAFPFHLEAKDEINVCVVDWATGGPKRHGLFPACNKYKKWDQLK